MKIKLVNMGFLAFLLAMFSGCTVIGDIFKAGVWSGIIIVVLIIAVVIFVISKMGKRGE